MRRFTAIVVFGLAILTTALSFLSEESYPRLVSLRSGLARQMEKNAELREQVNDLRREVSGLQGDKRSLEKAARNQLGMARPGERVFIFDRDNSRSERSGGAE